MHNKAEYDYSPFDEITDWIENIIKSLSTKTKYLHLILLNYINIFNIY
jgi:hypothetical protein